MGKKNKLTTAAEKIGAVIGKADRRAQKIAKAGQVAKQELRELRNQVEALKRQLEKTSERLKRALQ
jgi:hypothetical protein